MQQEHLSVETLASIKDAGIAAVALATVVLFLRHNREMMTMVFERLVKPLIDLIEKVSKDE